MYSASLTFPASYSLTGGITQALLIDIRRRQRHAAGRDPANILDVAVALDPGDDPVFPEHRHVHADIGQVGDPAVRAIDVVVEHDVALTNAVGAEDLVDRIDRRGERDAADGIALGVVDGNRKSCCSRIIDDIDVRSTAASISVTADSTLPSTISSVMGSIMNDGPFGTPHPIQPHPV